MIYLSIYALSSCFFHLFAIRKSAILIVFYYYTLLATITPITPPPQDYSIYIFFLLINQSWSFLSGNNSRNPQSCNSDGSIDLCLPLLSPVAVRLNYIYLSCDPSYKLYLTYKSWHLIPIISSEGVVVFYFILFLPESNLFFWFRLMPRKKKKTYCLPSMYNYQIQPEKKVFPSVLSQSLKSASVTGGERRWWLLKLKSMLSRLTCPYVTYS